ncbi:hypothetical protein BGV72_26645 [Burkholderia ubonensis]|nr:hypothetical protein WJ79_24430 [Burkholderia ubonensis]KVP54595.1 hypothetical protein WJ91_22160 [Burkholderia ubonensis]KVQ19729.1 hypothetical protein WJ98_19110 [Burkholderia ubonensis]KVX87670.1 hypothetical protein WL09_16960 [Burkholderia ubonensis]KVZ19989.1 hypothetical protein WL13_07140 [Burkholderia ubonensis]
MARVLVPIAMESSPDAAVLSVVFCIVSAALVSPVVTTVAAEPNAIERAPDASAEVPMAFASTPRLVASVPIALERSAIAAENEPRAIDCRPLL